MAYSALPRIEGAAHGVNYGFDRVRFVRPVPSGSRVRGHFTLRAVTPRSAREWQLTYDVSVEIEGSAEARAGGDLAHDAGDGRKTTSKLLDLLTGVGLVAAIRKQAGLG